MTEANLGLRWPLGGAFARNEANGTAPRERQIVHTGPFRKLCSDWCRAASGMQTHFGFLQGLNQSQGWNEAEAEAEWWQVTRHEPFTLG